MKPQLQNLLRRALETVWSEDAIEAPLPDSIQVEATRDTAHGDFATNLAMTLAKPLRRAPRQIAERLVAALPDDGLVERCEIAGPGFINFFLAPSAFQAVVPAVLAAGEAYGRAAPDSREPMLVEFVSANPTGPLHVGHGRNAAYGDTMARLLAAAGHRVHTEYYVNDAGRQTDILGVSLWLRYLERHGETVAFPANGYPADYVREAAEAVAAQFGDRLVRPAAEVSAELPPDESEGGDKEAHIDALIARARALLGDDYAALVRAGVAHQRARIEDTLSRFGVRFDRWFSEREMVERGEIDTALSRLRESGLAYEQDGALWLRTSELGDEKDRVLLRSDGSHTYFAADCAYHVDKLDRGFPVLLDVWGADHHGYVARVRAAIQALTGREDAFRVALMQFVTLSSGRMGKRSGNFVTLQQLIDEAGADATRFFYLMRSHDQHLEFDVELARSKSNDNPVYYVQYAHARICSVLAQLAERGLKVDEQPGADTLARLVEPQEKALLVLLQRYGEVIEAAAEQMAPHTLAFYLRELADALHSYYNAHAFLVDDAPLRSARIALVRATRTVLAAGLGLLGVNAPESM